MAIKKAAPTEDLQATERQLAPAVTLAVPYACMLQGANRVCDGIDPRCWMFGQRQPRPRVNWGSPEEHGM